MQFKKFVNKNVSANGECGAGGRYGVVRTDGGMIVTSGRGEHWITIVLPRNARKRIVEGIHIHFENRREMREFMKV